MLLRYMRGTFLLWFSAIWIVVGALVLAVAVLFAAQQHRRATGFYQVTGTVLGIRDTYHVDFVYVDKAGGNHNGSGQLSKREYAATRPGQPVSVYVSERMPSDAWPVSTGAPSPWLSLVIGAMGLAFLVPAAYFFGRYLREILRRVTALKRGRYVVGVAGGTVASGVTGPNSRCLTWSWPGEDGKRHTGKSIPVTKEYAAHWRKGDEIAVYIHPTDTSFAEADIFGYRSPM